MVTRYYSVLAVLTAWVVLSFGTAQLNPTPLSDEAYAKLLQAQDAASQALATYDAHFIDKPLWQEAIREGLEAREMAPGHPEPYRFLAQAYSQVKLYEQAWQAYLAYETYGGVLDGAAQQNLIELGIELGYTKYAQGQYRDAIGYYQTVVQLDPTLQTPTVQLALSQLATDDLNAALANFRTLAERYPDDPNYRRYVASVEDSLEYGRRASDAFYQGLSHYYEGDLDRAWLDFVRATRANDAYRDAFVWAGRVALELRQPEDAVTYWQRAHDLDPDDDAALYFLTVARKQARWGIDAYNAFEEGVNLYNSDDPVGAEARFSRATELNPDYAEAWAWLGRVHFEASDYSAAYSAYARAYTLEPGSEAYRYFYTEAGRLAGIATAPVAGAPVTPAEPTGETEPEVETVPEPVEAAPAPEPVPTAPPQSQTAPAQTTETQDPPTAPPSEAQAPPAPEPSPQPAPEPEAAPEPAPVATGPALVLLDVTRTLGETGTGKSAISFFKSASDLSTDLRAPVNYAGGTLYQRLEVLEKPSDEAVQLQLCLVPNEDISVRPTCSDASELSFTAHGTYEAQQSLTSFARYGGVDFARGISNLMVIAKNAAGEPIDPAYANLSEADLSRYYPMTIRYSAVLVPPGGRFPGW